MLAAMNKLVQVGGVERVLGGWCLEGDRSHRADVDAGLTFITGAFHLLKDPIEADHRAKAPLGEIHLRPAFFCSANTNAPSTQNTPVGIVVNEGMIFHNPGFFEELFKPLGFQTHAKKFGHVLESAFLVCRAVSAVHIMNREEQAKGASLQASHGRRIGVDNQWRGDSDGA